MTKIKISLEGILGKLYDALFKQDWRLILASLFGAFGIINLIDSLIVSYFGIPWEFIPYQIKPIFDLFREAIRPIFDFLGRIMNLSITEVWQQYLTMGVLVAGMRLRSTMVIYKAIKQRTITDYTEKSLGIKLLVNKNSQLPRWIAFFSIRLIYAFVLWPMKLLGASIRYLSDNKKTVITGEKKKQVEEIREMQYLTFFGTVAWALIIMVFFLLISATDPPSA